MRRRQSIAAVLAVALGLVAAAAGAGSAAPGPTDRSVKLDLIGKLKQGPEILILGDSRGQEAEPSFLQRLTGHNGFNAAVMGGSAPDAWVFSRYAADRFPRLKRRYIWFVSGGLTTNIVDPRLNADSRAQSYLQEVEPYLSTQTVSVPWRTGARFRPDGSLAHRRRASSPEHVRKVKAAAAKLVEQIRQHPPVAPVFDPARYQLFEHVLAYMNAHGSRPVIVLNPIYPTVFAELEKHGMPLRATSLDYLQALRHRLDFEVVDCRDMRVWGGSADDFSNPTHVDWRNMRRMLRYIVAHSNGALG